MITAIRDFLSSNWLLFVQNLEEVCLSLQVTLCQQLGLIIGSFQQQAYLSNISLQNCSGGSNCSLSHSTIAIWCNFFNNTHWPLYTRTVLISYENEISNSYIPARENPLLPFLKRNKYSSTHLLQKMLLRYCACLQHFLYLSVDAVEKLPGATHALR